VVNKFTL
jgi:hypothetical protein